jgi:hypothetical protein
LVYKVRRPAAGFFIALFPRPGGGTTLFSLETTCFSSGRKSGFGSGAPRMVIPCGHSSRWTSYWTLATTWYSTRLQENSRRPQPDEMRSIFADLGLGGEFWDPQSDSFG